MANAPDWVQALVLGIVQGLTEFIPVSSSGHLVLVPALAGWERHGLAFDVALHLGTLAALLVFYRADLWAMLRAVMSRTPSAARDAERRLVLLLAVGSVPVAIAGLALDTVIESVFAAPMATAWLLFGTAAVLVAGERLHRRRSGRASVHAGEPGASADQEPDVAGAPPLGLRHALVVGSAQAFALLPGMSRSGLTISAGVAAGLSRPTATRFAFLLGIPAIAGAAVVQAPQVDGLANISAMELAIGISAAAVSGYLAVAFLVRLVSRAGIDRFAWYVVPLATVSLLVFS